MMLSQSGISAAVATIVRANAAVTINIPAGKGGTLRAIELYHRPVVTDSVCTGGAVYLHNSAASWEPFNFLTPNFSCLTQAGDGVIKPMRYAVNKEIPGNSIVTMDVESYNALSQLYGLTLIWELGGKPKKETFVDIAHELAAATCASTARRDAAHLHVPAGKGGRVVYFATEIWPTLMVTTLSHGGLIEWENDAFDMAPAHWETTIAQTLGASGGGTVYPGVIPWDCPAPQNSQFDLFFTAEDATVTNSISGLIAWERPIRAIIS